MLAKLFRHSFRHPIFQLSWISLFVIFCIAGLPKLKTVLAIEKLLDDGLQASQNMMQLDEEFPRGLPVMFVFNTRSKEAFTHQELIEIEDWSFAASNSLEKDIFIQSPFQIRQAEWNGKELWSPTSWKREFHDQGLEFMDSTPWRGVLSSPQHNSFLMEFVFEKEGFNAYELKDYEILQKSVDAFVSTQSNIEVHLGGQASFEYYSHKGLERNNLLNLILFLAIILMLRWALGSWKGGLVFVMSVSLSALSTLGLMGWTGAPLDIVSSGIILMIAVAGLQDFLFVAQHIGLEGLRWRRAFRKILTASFFTSFTTFAGFASLTTSNLDTISRFGIWAGVGVIMEWIVTFLFLPAFLQFFPSLRQWTRKNGILESVRINRLLKKNLSFKWSLALLGFYGLAVWGAFNLNVTGAPKYMFPKSHPYVQGIASLKETRNWEDRAHVVVKNDLSNDEYSQLIQELNSLENVQSLVDPRSLKNDFVKELPQSLKSTAESGLTSVQTWKDWAFPFHERIEVYLKNTDLTPMNSFLEEANDLCKKHSCYLAGPIISQAEFAKKIPHEFILSMGLSIIVVALVLLALIYARSDVGKFSWAFAGAALAGSMWAPAVILFCYAIFQIKINVLACLFASVMVGMTGDNCIQYIFSGKYSSFDRGVKERGGTSITISILIALVCLIFLGSYFESPRVFGVFLGIGILLSLIGDIWVVQGLSPQTTQDKSSNS